MLRQVFTTPNPLAVVAMFAFIGLFVVVLYYVISDRRRKHIEHMEHLPLEDDRHG